MRSALSLLILIFGSTCLAQAESGRPIPDGGGPTEIAISMAILDIDEINTAEQNFTANLLIRLSWMDPTEKHDGDTAIIKPLADVWTPALLFVNQQKIWPTLPHEVKITPDGQVIYLQRVWGPFSQPMNVREFPFDSQDFDIMISSARYGTEEIAFSRDPENTSLIADKLSLPDWDITSSSIKIGEYKMTEWSTAIPNARLSFHAKRYTSHYMLKVILPLVLITAMSWIVFWINPGESGTQIGVSTTSMLTLIAYRFMVGGLLPAVPYLTLMDLFILGSTFLVFAALIQAVLTSIMHNSGKKEQAVKVDRICRFVFPGIFLTGMVVLPLVIEVSEPLFK